LPAPFHQILVQLALLAAVRGDVAEEAALLRAAAFVRDHRIDFDADLERFLAGPLAGTDPELLKRLQHLHEPSASVLMEWALAGLPADLRWLLESGAVTGEQLAALHRELGVTSAADLTSALADRAIRGLAGFDESVEAAIEAALPTLRRAIPRIPLGRAVELTEPILTRLRSVNGVAWASSAGSVRRGQDTVGDVEIVAATTRPADAIAELLQMFETTRPRHRSERRLYLLIQRVQVGIRLPDPANAGAVLLQMTGAAAHLSALRAHASRANWRLTREGLQGPDGRLRPSPTEEDIYSVLNLPFIPPEIRNGDAEVQAAANGELPPLLARGDIRGDLHMHSTFSDGRDTVEAMVQASRRLGYEYIAITDHSPSSAASRNLSMDSIERQADEIGRLREQYPDIAILHGCEVDILPDGRLDFPDRVLERLDIVLASLHERAGSSRDDLLRRYTAAMKHPLVALITHPTNRFVPTKPGYDLDYEALFAMAVETGTIVEIDGAPAHLDLDGALAKQAVAAGATMAVDSDCHRAALLEMQMDLGVITARRGWVERRHVVNTRPLSDVLAAVSAKRRR
jgi:DNA polymerase (family 10)